MNISIEQFTVSDPVNLGVNIKVTDQGIGITEEDRKNLFKVFFKTKNLLS